MKEIGYGGEEIEYDENGDIVEYYAQRPNKSQIKRDIAEVAKLAEQLTQIADEQLAEMQMPDKLESAISEAKKMSGSKPARKRQMKFVTAQLRQIDLQPIQEMVDRIQSKSVHGVREHHQAEKWRDRLINDEGNSVLTEILDQYPNADRQYLRQLQRNAQKENKMAKPPKSARLLYQYLKSLIQDK